MSLIGAAIAGGIEGAGKGAGEALKQEQEYVGKSDLQSQFMQAQEQKELRMAEVGQQYHEKNTATDFANTRTLKGEQNQFEWDKMGAEQDWQDSARADEQAFRERLNKADLESRERVAKASNEVTLQAAREGHMSFQTSDEGHVLAVQKDKDGNLQVTELQDPVTKKPIVSQKDLPQSQIMLGKVYMDSAESKKLTDPTGAEADRQMAIKIFSGGAAKGQFKDVTTLPRSALQRLVGAAGKGDDSGRGAPSPEGIEMFNAEAEKAGYGPKAFERWAVQRAQKRGSDGIINSQAFAGDFGGSSDTGASSGKAAAGAPTAAQAEAGKNAEVKLPPLPEGGLSASGYPRMAPRPSEPATPAKNSAYRHDPAERHASK
jgi:hypothetical protein